MEAAGAEAEASLRGQVEIWKYTLSFADSMALKSAVELRIPDIIHSHAGPMTVAQIASAIPDSPSPDLYCLARIMRLLVRRRIFTAQQPSDDGGEALYGPTHSSRWLLSETAAPDQLTLAPMVLMENHPWLMAPWHCFSRCVREGGIAFEKAHGGRHIWDFAAENPEFNKLFNDAMECTARIIMRAILSEYRDGFGGCCLRSLVDVGGGTGGAVSEIVRSHPHIRGINFDLPHVVATAPEYPGCHMSEVTCLKASPLLTQFL
ncbi:O-methyltransferase COMT-type [Parasponia andersonii]|uniref:O-methyltransferase COMT-type n=1 Tax=Parasponia andersonii TaxID=3476 RepID=A0A2P5AA68_PARAD|nr:O-methyltransferase COMT-type [Parasponia andersonii]